MATHSSTLAWKIPWTEEPGRLQSMGSLRVGHDWAFTLTFLLSLFLSCIGEGNGNPLQCSCLENPRDGWAWWAAVYGVAQSRTRLKQLSSSSSRNKWVLPLQPFLSVSKSPTECCVPWLYKKEAFLPTPFCIPHNYSHSELQRRPYFPMKKI